MFDFVSAPYSNRNRILPCKLIAPQRLTSIKTASIAISSSTAVRQPLRPLISVCGTCKVKQGLITTRPCHDGPPTSPDKITDHRSWRDQRPERW
ncbi:hypothetical protein RRG08_033253 [Elysia crispata]|uniref:Uncharacterized protein n=1 Tax=Elysia crispata TaxID=231223 RepID=A0AAE0ZCZ3_9GAST|nr:hypothetical protein RRG08_033253 [Elysia crispata]